MDRTWVALGALFGLLAVGAAAAVAHAPAWGGAAMRDAVQMLGWHALALLATGLWAPHGGRLADLAGAAFALGTVMFCGAVYLLALTGVSLGFVAPTGGTLCMLGWLLLGLSALRAR